MHDNRITLRITERSVTEMGKEGMNSSTHIPNSYKAGEESCSGFRTEAEDKGLWGFLSVGGNSFHTSGVRFSHHVHMLMKVASVVTCLSSCLGIWERI